MIAVLQPGDIVAIFRTLDEAKKFNDETKDDWLFELTWMEIDFGEIPPEVTWAAGNDFEEEA